MKSFEDAEQVKLSDADRSALERLSNNRNFIVFKRIVEDYMLKLSHNLIAGTETEKGSSEEELKAMRGFVKYWKKIVVNLVDNEDTHKHGE